MEDDSSAHRELVSYTCRSIPSPCISRSQGDDDDMDLDYAGAYIEGCHIPSVEFHLAPTEHDDEASSPISDLSSTPCTDGEGGHLESVRFTLSLNLLISCLPRTTICSWISKIR